MDTVSIRRIRDALIALSGWSGVPVLWRSSLHAQTAPILGEARYHHCNPFCMAVKSRVSLLARCNPRESSELAQEVGRQRGPYLKSCHAGVVEWVAPILPGGRYHGVLLAGPFRQEGATCPYRGLDGMFAALPILSRKRQQPLAAALALLAEHIALLHQTSLVRQQAAATAEPRIRATLDFIAGNLGAPLRASTLARRCGLSPSRFVHLFAQECGVPFSTYVARLRVAEAQHLLLTSGRSLADIALETGFPDQSYFGTVFRKHTGSTPRRFRSEGRLRLQA